MAHITLSQLTTVLQRIVSWATGKFAAKNTYSGKIEYADMPVVVLASMGSELDGTSTQRPMSAGDTYYLPAGQGAGARIMFVDSNGTAVKISDPESNVIYCNAYTGLLYRWDASETDMVPVGGDGDGLRKVYVGNSDFSSLDTIYSGVYQVIEQSTQRIIGVLVASSDNKIGANPYFVTQWLFSNLVLSDEYSGSFNGYYTNGRAHIIHRFYNASNSSSDIPLNTWSEWKVYGLTLDEVSELLNAKQDTLVSGTNIKTVNNTSILGSGDIAIADGKSAYQSYVDTTSDSPVKTEAQWVASLKGDKGETGATGATGSVTVTDGVAQITIVNDLTTGGAGDALSAEQGKVLKQAVNPLLGFTESVSDNVTYETGKCYESYGVGVNSTYTGKNRGGSYARAKLSVSAGDTVTVYGKTDVWCALYIITDSSDKVVSVGSASANVTQENAITLNITKDGTVYLSASNSASYGATHSYNSYKVATTTNDGIMTKEQVSALSLIDGITYIEDANKNLDKRKFGRIGTGSDVFAKYYELPMSLFNNTVFFWKSDGGQISFNTSWNAGYNSSSSSGSGYVNMNARLIWSDNDAYRIYYLDVSGWKGSYDKIRISLYGKEDNFFDDIFIGSDLDADYLSWDFIKLKQVPPVTDAWFAGESKEILAITNQKLKPYNMEGVRVSQKNLYNPYEKTYAGQVSGGASPNYPLFNSGYIAVEENTVYTLTLEDSTFVTGVIFYDSSKQSLGTNNYARHTTPSGCAYVRFALNSYNDGLDNLEYDAKIQYEKGEATEYEPYYIFPTKDTKSILSGKIVSVLGDSFTAPGAWQQEMASILGVKLIGNQAKSGGSWSGTSELGAYQQAQALVTGFSTAAQNQTSPPLPPDYILCVMGTNDVNNSISLGSIVNTETISNLDLSTITGGVQAALITLKNAFPNSVIKIGYTPAGYIHDSAGMMSTSNALCERLKELAYFYGVDYIETRSCGICPYMAADAEAYCYGGHPTSDGHKKIGQSMARILLSNL